MANWKSLSKRLKTQARHQGLRFGERFSALASPRLSDHVLHLIERQNTLEELNLDVPSWRTSEVQVQQHEIEPACDIVVPESGGLHAESHTWPNFYVRELKGVTLDVDSGLIFTKDRVITQSGNGTRSARDSAFISSAAARFQKLETNSVAFPVAAIGDTWHHYHFLLETLPRILHIRSIVPDIQFVTSQNMSPAAADCFSLLDIGVLVMDEGKLINAPSIFMSDSPTKFWPRSADIDILRDAFLTPNQSKSPKLKSTIYISRSNSDRSPRGETAVEKLLQKNDTQIVFLEQLSFLEQVKTVRSARAIIGPHGAGLANIVFLDPESKVIEFSSGDRFESCYRRIAALSGLDYQYLQISGDSQSPFGTFSDEDLDRLMQALT